MKKNITLSVLFIALLAFTFLLITWKWSKGYEDLNKCLIKYHFEWGLSGSQCRESSKSYAVFFRNECYKKIDVKCAVQEIDKRWKTYTRLGMNYNDTISGYACSGTGKYLYWVKSVDDKSTVFPTDDEIQNLNTENNK